MSVRLLSCLVCIFSGLLGGGAYAQDGGGTQQMLVDIDALVVSIEVTTRCALFDTTLDYLTPLEQVGAGLRLDELVAAGTNRVADMPDRLAAMRAEAAAIACGDDGLPAYMDFSRQIARDMVDIALVAWRSIDIERCNYFADDDFLAAAERARAAAEQATVEGEANRVVYIEERAAFWRDTFANNCANLQFRPADTVPGRIALALPTQ